LKKPSAGGPLDHAFRIPRAADATQHTEPEALDPEMKLRTSITLPAVSLRKNCRQAQIQSWPMAASLRPPPGCVSRGDRG